MDKEIYLIELSETPKSDFGKRAFSEQRFPQKVFSSIWELESEVLNGGLSQYFINCWGEDSIAFSPEAFRAIGALHRARIIEQALALRPPTIPDEFEARQEYFDSREALTAKLSELDDEYYASPDNVTDLLFAFVGAHPQEFGPTPAR